MQTQPTVYFSARFIYHLSYSHNHLTFLFLWWKRCCSCRGWIFHWFSGSYHSLPYHMWYAILVSLLILVSKLSTKMLRKPMACAECWPHEVLAFGLKFPIMIRERQMYPPCHPKTVHTASLSRASHHHLPLPHGVGQPVRTHGPHHAEALQAGLVLPLLGELLLLRTLGLHKLFPAFGRTFNVPIQVTESFHWRQCLGNFRESCTDRNFCSKGVQASANIYTIVPHWEPSLEGSISLQETSWKREDIDHSFSANDLQLCKV